MIPINLICTAVIFYFCGFFTSAHSDRKRNLTKCRHFVVFHIFIAYYFLLLALLFTVLVVLVAASGT